MGPLGRTACSAWIHCCVSWSCSSTTVLNTTLYSAPPCVVRPTSLFLLFLSRQLSCPCFPLSSWNHLWWELGSSRASVRVCNILWACMLMCFLWDSCPLLCLLCEWWFQISLMDALMWISEYWDSSDEKKNWWACYLVCHVYVWVTRAFEVMSLIYCPNAEE